MTRGALAAYHEALRIDHRLATQDPANAQWQRDLVVSYMRLGDVEKQKGNTTGAVDFFTQARAISARMVERDPTNAVWKNDLVWVEQQIDALKSE